MKQSIRSFVGMDVHKATISISVADLSRAGSRYRLSGLPGDGLDRTGEKRRFDQQDFCDGCELVAGTTCGSTARIARH